MHLDFVVTAPALALVCAAVYGAVLTRGGDAERGVKSFAVRAHLDIAAIGRRREAANFHVLPGLTAIMRLDQPHPSREDHAIRICRIDRDRVTVEHTLVVGIADD